jgi:hypothetical protein
MNGATNALICEGDWKVGREGARLRWGTSRGKEGGGRKGGFGQQKRKPVVEVRKAKARGIRETEENTKCEQLQSNT